MDVLQTGNGQRQVPRSGLGGDSAPFTDVPVIDFAPMSNGAEAQRRATGAAVREACIRVGFFYAINHGVQAHTIATTYDTARRFFSLPLERKLALHLSRSSNHRGYVPLLEENTDPSARGDLHEAFDMALEIAADDPEVLAGKSLYGPNQWPEQLPGFRSAMETYYQEVFQFGRKVFRAFALAIGIEEDFFETLIVKPLAQLRVLHYPSQPALVDDRRIGIGAHSDYECFTILSTDDVPALQLLNSDGQWIAAPPLPGALILNVGDMMARWTNDLFRSTVHRAINRSGRERYSIPFFFGPDFDTNIEAFPTCVTPERPAKFPPITAGRYIASRFDDTFSYRKKHTSS